MNEFMKECVDCLGYRAKDKITGYDGVCSTISFDLYGCIQIGITPLMKDDSKDLPKCYGFDIHRLEIDKSARVMEIPNFAAMSYRTETKEPSTAPADFKHGSAEKPKNMFR